MNVGHNTYIIMRGEVVKMELIGHKVTGYAFGKKYSWTFAVLEASLAENLALAIGLSKIQTYPVYK